MRHYCIGSADWESRSGVWFFAEYNKGALLAGRDGDLFEIWAALEFEDSLVVRSNCKRTFPGFSKSDGAKS